MNKDLKFRAELAHPTKEETHAFGYYYKNDITETYYIIETLKTGDDPQYWTQELRVIKRDTLELVLPSGESTNVDQYMKALASEEIEESSEDSSEKEETKKD